MHRRRINIHIDNPQPNTIQKRKPLLMRALTRSQRRHHGQIHLGGLPIDARVRQDHVVDQNHRVWRESSYAVREDHGALVVGEIMEDASHVVEFCAWDGS